MGADVYLLLLRGFRLRKEDAEDVAQELRLFCFQKGIDATDPRNWGRLRKVAGWMVARHHRGRVREVSLSEGEELEDPSARVDVDQREVRMWFEQVCEQAGLRKKDQDFFWLCAVEGYTHREVAEAVGWSPQAGTVHFQRILKRLRNVAGGP